jgi:hypothetical protein
VKVDVLAAARAEYARTGGAITFAPVALSLLAELVDGVGPVRVSAREREDGLVELVFQRESEPEPR